MLPAIATLEWKQWNWSGSQLSLWATIAGIVSTAAIENQPKLCLLNWKEVFMEQG